MTNPDAVGEVAVDLDVRPLPQPDKHPTIFATYDALSVGAAFVLINDHDPQRLHDEFETEHPGSYHWEYLKREPHDWRIRITKLASTPLPRVLARTDQLAEVDEPDAAGAIWKLPVSQRDLDSNIIALPPNGTIAAHAGPNLDVLIHVLAGSGVLTTELDTLDLVPGAIVWLPRGSHRQFTAGPDGLRYLTVHQRRQALALDTSRAKARR